METDERTRVLGEHHLLQNYLGEVTVPIFYDLDGTPEARGTGTLLDVGGHLLLITAAHVLEGKDITKFSSPWNRPTGEGATWGSVGFLTPKSSGAWDVAIIELLHPETVEAFRKNYWRITVDQIAMPTRGATHILAGYPAELTTATLTTIDQTPFAYYTEMLAEHPAEVKDPNPAWDLFFRLDRQGELFTGKLQDMPQLAGASGCVIWEQTGYDGPLWTAGKTLKAVGIQRSARAGHWFRASNWLAVVPLLAEIDRHAAAELAVSLLGAERVDELMAASGHGLRE